MVRQWLAHSLQLRVAAEDTAQQEAVDLFPDRLHQALETPAGDGPIATTRPVPKQCLRGAHQITSEAIDLVIGMIDQRLKIPFQMRPTPLGTAHVPIHLRPVAIHDAIEGVREQFLEDRRGPRGSQREDRLCARDKGPQPRFELRLFRRRFVDTQHRFGRQLGRQFVIDRRERGRRLILQLDHPAPGARLIQHLLQKQRHPPLALFEAAHQQRGQRDQPGTGLTERHTGRKFSAGEDAATRTRKSMPLIFRDNRFDFRDFPNLMSQWVGIVPGQTCPTSSTHLRFHTFDLLALVRRNQRSFVLGMAGLPSLFLTALFPLGYWLGMRVFGARRKRRIAGSFLNRRNSRLQQRNLGQQKPNDRLSRRRLLGDGFLGYQIVMRHECDVADSPKRAKVIFKLSRSRGVNGYVGLDTNSQSSTPFKYCRSKFLLFS